MYARKRLINYYEGKIEPFKIVGVKLKKVKYVRINKIIRRSL